MGRAVSMGAFVLASLREGESALASPSGGDGLRDVLEAVRAEHDLPALAGGVVLGGRPAAFAAVGHRKYGGDIQVTVDDQFHIGSCTKAMTATLVGILVEEGRLAWETTLADALPDLERVMHPALRGVTVEMLLVHRAGLPERSWPRGKDGDDMRRLPGEPREQRRAYVEQFVREGPESEPGKKYVYSNAGYAILGAIAEWVTDTAWERLLTRRVFEPLGMKSAGFGAMGTPGKVDQPWQHPTRRRGKPVPLEPGPMGDNPPVIGPGGSVHCSVPDWAKFVGAHLRAGRRERPERRLLRPETFARLHTAAFGGKYAGGWVVTEREWGGGGRVLTHAGSNTASFAEAWMAPLRDAAILVAANEAGDVAEKACGEAVKSVAERYLAE